MEWNARPPLQWDWENLTVLGSRMAENGNKLHPANFLSKQGINFPSFNSAGNNRSTGCPVSELGQASPKSSKSVSITSSSLEDSRSSKFTLEGFDASLEDFGSKKEFMEAEVANTYATLETSICSCEPMLSLKLGKPAYFGDASAGNHTKPSFSVMQSEATRKRCKSVLQNTLSPHCQVEGCGIELTNVKDYYRKHRVCESHSKSPKVIIGGIERRFCQQCSRFHSLSEFDEKKRSCRRRLSNHNARRRKPQSKAISLNPARPSSLDFERQQIGLRPDELSFVYPGPNANSTWEATFSSKRSQCSMYVLKPEKACGMTMQLNIFGDEMSSANAMPNHDSSKLLPSKGAETKVLDTGLEGYVISSSLHTAQDVHRALSLLSTDLRGPCEAKFFSSDNSGRPDNPNYCTNQTSMSQPARHMAIQSYPFASADSECWCIEQQSIQSQMQIFHPNTEGNGFFQDFQLFKSPCEIEVYSNLLS